jgi:hypothetical protein
MAFRRLLLAALLAGILMACSSEPDDDLVGWTATQSCQVDPKCSPADRELADAYEAQCHEVTTVGGEQVLIDHCIKQLARAAGTDHYVWVNEDDLTGEESAALFRAEDRKFHRP